MQKKIVIIEDYYASGDDIVNFIAQQTPPGLKARIMGMQNIKGTGLDYVYRWQAWDICYQACQKIISNDDSIAEAGIKQLAQYKEYGVLSEQYVLQTLDLVKERGWTQKEEVQSEIVLIKNNLKTVLTLIKKTDKSKNSSSIIGVKLAEYIEAFLDVGDAVKRRKRASQIYRDLQAARISYERAALELQKLNKRQKGGWGGEFIDKL